MAVADKSKLVYFFGDGKADGTASMKAYLGGKGANLADMTLIGLPVPPGFTISTEACAFYSEHDGAYPEGLRDEVLTNLRKLEKLMGAKLGDPKNPLLVSVRSGAAQSMPGMMDTILNLGINPDSVNGLIEKTGNQRFAWDSYRRFIQMFGDVVMGVPHHDFEEILQSVKNEKGVTLDTQLDVDDLKEVISRYLALYKKVTGKEFPTNPEEQLFASINAVFRSWNNDRAIKYRQMNDIRGLLGTAVNVQSMVFGNMGDTSGTGVAFTRDPSTGENIFYGEYLMNAQGEDVVAGIRTPAPIETLRKINPEVFNQLVDIRHILETHYKDMQDLEFTIQEGKLYILQTRSGKRTIFSWLRSQVEMVNEGLISKETAVSRIPAGEFGKLFAPVLDGSDIKKKGISAIAKGLNASPGGACGQIYFTADKAEKAAAQGKAVILVRTETSPEDIGGMAASKGIITCRGGMTSHAAVVARGMGCPCVSGVSALHINYAKSTLEVAGRVLKEGDFMAMDGFTGDVYAEKIAVKPSEIVQVLGGNLKEEDSRLYQDYKAFMSYVDEIKDMAVRTNADTPEDATMAVRLGAEGIGLCRTEHMFFGGRRIISIRKMILASSTEAREKALAELLPMQKEDFIGIFKAMGGLPTTIRLLDPPLHEFLPNDDASKKEMAEQLGVSIAVVEQKSAELHEFNPMLGFRGCRLAIIYPEILRMQVRAIIEAALEVKKAGIAVHPEIMIPLVGIYKEFDYCKKHAEDEISKVFAEKGTSVSYKVGTMIEVPRAALTADEIARSAEFFSFGTNDLTQMACGFSRDDAASFLGPYVNDTDKQFYDYDPFTTIDIDGVGKLLKIAVDLGRSVRKDIKLGICGEHGGDPKTIAFCESLGLNYVSCSPFRVPIARLASAQAKLSKRS
ncbi:pyruvate, phosphate dikinase [Parasphaerochaeta coccoides]|uniref:Pyruvate, phosphate dikinase n=1 Tax=Parasphaerochaeta coccoides (strain ATCC BAA-1237 / DSM 17374 / SPN1) TaxID=760011 RepID=F4GKU3_PARC1|nr:pyruvate, phosphate dikinase [Parasphaerochaeta coccoides]AEC01856.1 pyruvate phosphate dikinase [Parasphaerochaeta coccoides DSM 17374]